MDSKLGGVPPPAKHSAPKFSLSTSPGSSLPIRAPPSLDSDFEIPISLNGQKIRNSSSTSSSSDTEFEFESDGFLSGEDDFETASERPFVPDPEDGTPKESDGDDDDECFGEPEVGEVGVSAFGRMGAPIAMVSRDSEDDSVSSEEMEDDGFWGSVRVPGIHLSGRIDSPVQVRVFGVEEGEDGEKEEEDEEEEELEPALEAEVVKDLDTILGSSERCIEVKYSVNDYVADQMINDEVSDDAGESTDDFFREDSRKREDVLNSVGEIERLEKMELRESEEESEVIVIGVHKQGLLHPIDEAEGIVLTKFEANVDGEIDGKRVLQDLGAEVLGGSGAFNLGSDVTNCENDETTDSKFLEEDNLAGRLVERSLPWATIEVKMPEMEADFAEVGTNVNSGAKVLMDDQNSETKCVDLSKSVIPGRGSDDEKPESINEQSIDLGVELYDFVACSGFEPVDDVIEGIGIQNMDSTRFSEPYPVQETECYRNSFSPITVEYNVIEEGLHNKTNTLDPLSLVSNLNPELEARAEVEDEAGQDMENSEGSNSEDDSKGVIFGVSETTKLIIDDDFEQSSTATSVGESSQGLLQRTEGPIVANSDQEVESDGESEGTELFGSSVLANLLKAATGAQANHPSLFTNLGLTARSRSESEENLNEEERKRLEKIQLIRVKFLSIVNRLGQSSDDSIAAQVLYRLDLIARRPSSRSFDLELAKRMAMQLEAEGSKNDLDFSLNILVLGKTGVGKSATINSIFGETKAMTDAFEPATICVKDIVGTIDGIKVRIFDTPGLRSSSMEQAFNRKILLSIRKLTKKCPPDVVLYVDRLDTQTRDLNDLPLLRSVTSLLGSSIWKNAIVTLTHAASIPPDGPSGSPLSFDSFVAQRSRIIQQLISQAIGDLGMMNPSLINPVSLAENHPSSQKREDGQIVLPNGESWRPQLLLLCYSMKILSEANSVAKTQDLFDHRTLFGFRAHSPLPYFLSSLLQSNTHPKLPSEQRGDNVDSDTELGELGDFSDSDQEDEHEYDQLPPFKPLNRSQVVKLSKEQRNAYFEEYDYRVRLLQKQQLREEVKRLRELKKRGKDGPNNYGYPEVETGSPAAVGVPLPDMTLPPSFDGDNPAYRYRFLEPTSLLLTRPVLDVQGWDHDCGYDGVSLESSLAIAGFLPAVIAVQTTKDKKDFNIQFDSSVAVKHGVNGSTMTGFNIQTVGKQFSYILKGETKIKYYKTIKTAAGLSVIFLGENVATGLKIEDQISVGKRLVLVGNTGAIRSQGDTAYGANLEVRLREKDFPIGQDQTTLGLSLMRWRGDFVWAGNLQSQFSIGRSSKMAVRAGLNSKLSGQVSVRTSSSEQLQIAILGILPIANAIFRNIFPRFSEKYLSQ
ncbi:hypothetical protein U1Q18_030955 [Sarracenia purpurea var. burkii]